MNKKQLAAILMVSLVLPLALVLGYAFYPYTWGEKGSLTLTISLDRTEMPVKEYLNATLVLKNSGSEKVRVLRCYSQGYFDVILYDSQNKTVHCIRPMASMARVEPSYYNQYMVTLEPGATMNAAVQVGNDTSWGNWDIQPNNTYKAVGEYYCYPVSGSMVLPHWAGTVLSGPEYFTVK